MLGRKCCVIIKIKGTSYIFNKYLLPIIMYIMRGLRVANGSQNRPGPTSEPFFCLNFILKYLHHLLFLLFSFIIIIIIIIIILIFITSKDTFTEYNNPSAAVHILLTFESANRVELG